ncbi:hypothetical protein, partial [Nocardia gipuzkoensis]
MSDFSTPGAVRQHPRTALSCLIKTIGRERIVGREHDSPHGAAAEHADRWRWHSVGVSGVVGGGEFDHHGQAFAGVVQIE